MSPDQSRRLRPYPAQVADPPVPAFMTERAFCAGLPVAAFMAERVSWEWVAEPVVAAFVAGRVSWGWVAELAVAAFMAERASWEWVADSAMPAFIAERLSREWVAEPPVAAFMAERAPWEGVAEPPVLAVVAFVAERASCVAGQWATNPAPRSLPRAGANVGFGEIGGVHRGLLRRRTSALGFSGTSADGLRAGPLRAGECQCSPWSPSTPSAVRRNSSGLAVHVGAASKLRKRAVEPPGSAGFAVVDGCGAAFRERVTA